MSDEEYRADGYALDPLDGLYSLEDDEMNSFIAEFKRRGDATPSVPAPEPIVFSDDDDLGEDDFDEHYDLRDALRSAANFKTKKAQTSSSRSYYRRKMIKLTAKDQLPEVRAAMSEANEAFIRKDYMVAQAKYREVVSLDRRNFFAYKTLGEISKILGRLDQCCNYWVLAALIHNWDHAFWAAVGELSSQLGYIDQAIQCYSHAITLDMTKLAKYVVERSNLYRERGNYGRALDGFNRVRQAFPRDADIIKMIALTYLELNRGSDAIRLYQEIRNSNIRVDPSVPEAKRQFVAFGWTELNILLELYQQMNMWREGIQEVKTVTRWMQGRMGEGWWKDYDDDAEFDVERRNKVIMRQRIPEVQKKTAYDADFQILIDIRYRMGVFRLELGDKEEALRHFSCLFKEEDEEVDDLFMEAGKHLEDHGYHQEAIDYLARAVRNPEFQNNSEIYALLGRCFLETKDYGSAKEAYQKVLMIDPEEPEHYMTMMEILLYLGEQDEALEYNDRLQWILKLKAPEVLEEVAQEDESLKNALIKSQRHQKQHKAKKMTEEEREQHNKEMTRKVLARYRRMEALRDQIIIGDNVAIKTWCQHAQRLFDMFCQVKEFFPRDRLRQLKGVVHYRRQKSMGLDERLLRLYNLVEGMDMANDNEDHLHLVSDKNEFRGLTFDQWFDIFCEYAILLTKFERRIEHAREIMDTTLHVGAFLQDRNKELFLHLVLLHLALTTRDYTEVSRVVRFFLNGNQFSPFIYKFFTCCYALGLISWESLTSYNHQKFFLRQLKAYDSVISGQKISGMATVVDPSIRERRDDLGPELPDLIFIYGSLLGGARLFASPVVYLTRAYKQFNRDPMVCLQLGISHIHRSMQRLSNNRHMQFLQGVSFMMEYRQRRLEDPTNYKRQEVEYNFGRMFHMVGLLLLAVKHYENVLQYEVEENHDLSIEAAYNLLLIYTLNGNLQLAHEYTVRYLTI